MEDIFAHTFQNAPPPLLKYSAPSRPLILILPLVTQVHVGLTKNFPALEVEKWKHSFDNWIVQLYVAAYLLTNINTAHTVPDTAAPKATSTTTMYAVTYAEK